VAGEKFRRHSRAPQEVGKKAFVIFNPAGTGGQINEKDPALHGRHLLPSGSRSIMAITPFGQYCTHCPQ
jgi:hypothetical protein